MLGLFKKKRDELAELRAEISRLREMVELALTESAKQQEEINVLKAEIESRETYVNEDGERVPMSQVLNEYLYGAKEGDT